VLNVDAIAAVIGGAAAVSSFGQIAARVFALRRRSDLRLTLKKADGSSLTVDWDPNNAEQVEKLSELLLQDEIVSVDPEKQVGQDGGGDAE
jgi:hypothetical protein